MRRSPRLARKAELATDPLMRQYKNQLAVLLDILNDLESDFSNCASLVPEEEDWVDSDLEEVAGLCMGLLILGGSPYVKELRQLDGGRFGSYNEMAYQMENLVKLVRGGNKRALTTLRRHIATLQTGVRDIVWKIVKTFP